MQKDPITTVALSRAEISELLAVLSPTIKNPVLTQARDKLRRCCPPPPETKKKGASNDG